MQKGRKNVFQIGKNYFEQKRQCHVNYMYMYLVYYNNTSYNTLDILTTKVFIPVEWNK